MRKQAKLLANFLGATKELTGEYAALAEITDNEFNQIGFTVMKREDRKTTAKALAAKGHTTREIAALTGWSHNTIATDLRVTNVTKPVTNVTPSASSADGHAIREVREDFPPDAELTNAMSDFIAQALAAFEPKFWAWLESNPSHEARLAMHSNMQASGETLVAWAAKIFDGEE